MLHTASVRNQKLLTNEIFSAIELYFERRIYIWPVRVAFHTIRLAINKRSGTFKWQSRQMFLFVASINLSFRFRSRSHPRCLFLALSIALAIERNRNSIELN